MTESYYIDRLSNSGIEIDAAGRRIKVAQVTMRHQGELQAIIRETQPYPSTHAKKVIAGLPPAVATEIMKQAIKEDQFWPLPVASGDGINFLLASEKGQKMLFKVACQGANKFTEEQIDEIFLDLTAIEMNRIAVIAITGEDSIGDPKAPSQSIAGTQ